MTTHIEPTKIIHGTIDYNLTKQELDEAVRRYIVTTTGKQLGQMKSSYSVSFPYSCGFQGKDNTAFTMTFYAE